jgi:hypothetical protein
MHAQQFWMRPDKFHYQPGDTVRINFYVGDNLIGETWNLKKARIKRLELIQGETTTDLRELAREGKSKHLKFVPEGPGTWVVVMESQNSFIEIDATNFNAYLKENALDDALNARKKAGTTETPGREHYARIAKAIIQVGDSLTGDFSRPAGTSMEIMPELHPAQLKAGESCKFKVLYAGKPVFGARAYVWNNQNTRTYSQPIYTQQDGTIDTRLFNPGLWMVSVVKMVPADGVEADWQSYWCTYVFEVRP